MNTNPAAPPKPALNWRAGFIGAALAVAAGLLLWSSRLGDGLQNLSYDLIFLFKRAVVPEEAVIVYVDEKSCQELGQEPKTWNRTLYAQLLDRLTADGARLVVLDVVFSGARDAEGDDALARALKDNGRVVLAAGEESEVHQDLSARSLTMPLGKFLSAAAGWGIAGLEQDQVRRRFVPIKELGTNLAWAAAALATRGKPRWTPAPGEACWLNYYGMQGLTLRNVSFCEVKNEPVGFFRDKVVFVGGRPSTPHLFDQAEENVTPLTVWGDVYFPGVDLVATAFLNLHRGECLHRTSRRAEFLALAVCGLVFGLTLGAFRPLVAATLMAVVLLVLVLGLIQLFNRQQLWFPWTLAFLVQWPCALGGAAYARLARRKKTDAPAPQPVHPVPAIASSAGSSSADGLPDESSSAPQIPDHQMLRIVGRGAYGEVWLARNAVGIYRAVKIVHRAAFETDDPYEREFRGITKFMPLSLNHPKLVRLVHVGRNVPGGYFYYIMETADDERSGQEINPTTYSPKNLFRELDRRHRLPPLECIDLGLELAAALAYLHQHQLIHRDIKPANIIYVEGAPKMADIGLVTDIHTMPGGSTYVGTTGYIAPEGPGTAKGDVFSLGKVLYQAATGLPVDQFPVIPTSLVNQADSAMLIQLNKVILKACDADAAQRFQTAAELFAALESLKARLLQESAPPSEAGPP